MNEDRIFKAYCRSLLRTLEQIECHLENIEPELALISVKEMKEHLRKDMA